MILGSHFYSSNLRCADVVNIGFHLYSTNMLHTQYVSPIGVTHVECYLDLYDPDYSPGMLAVDLLVTYWLVGHCINLDDELSVYRSMVTPPPLRSPACYLIHSCDELLFVRCTQY